MLEVWTTVVAPLLEVCRPVTVVEIGGGDEDFSALLRTSSEDHCGTVYRSADPSELEVAGPEFAVLHGQPNWYSVSQGLRRLDEMAGAANAPYPVTLVHGVDWPTARRDAYPEPSSIPVGALQPHAFDAGVQRALDSHDQRNGVLTGVEDFVASEGAGLELVHLPGLGGTAILVDGRRLRGKGSRSLSQLVKELSLGLPALAQLAAVDADRIRAEAQLAELAIELGNARAGRVAEVDSRLETMRERADQLSARNAELTEMIARKEARLRALESGKWPRSESAPLRRPRPSRIAI